MWCGAQYDDLTPCGGVRRHPQGRSPPPSRPLLPSPAPSVTAITQLPVPHRLQPPRHRHPHRADGQSIAGGGTGERGTPIPVRGCLSVADAHTRVQIPGGDSRSTGCRNIVVSVVQPLTGLWGIPHRQRLPTGNPSRGSGGAVGNVLALQRGMRERDREGCGNGIGQNAGINPAPPYRNRLYRKHNTSDGIIDKERSLKF